MRRTYPPDPFINYPKKHVFWEPEPFDECIPETPGFMTDLILATRGSGVPTMFHIWGCLTVMSAFIKREAWIQWFPGKLYSNLYTILVGAPGRMYKSTSVNISFKLLKNITEYIQDPNMKVIKNIDIMDGKITPEKLLDRLKPKPGEYELVDVNGNPIIGKLTKKPLTYAYTSEIMIVASELSSLLSKASYNEGMIVNLLKLYDCDDEWSTDTFTRDKTVLKNIYSTILAACTPSQFNVSIPKAVVSDGFLTRTNIVYCRKNYRRYDEPKPIKDGPTQEHLKKSLAWIGENIRGEYTFSPEAKKWFSNWYQSYLTELETNPSQAEFKARLDIKLRQLAFLVTAQRYNITKVISLQDTLTAHKILTRTFQSSLELIHNFAASDIQKLTIRILNYIRIKRRVFRNKFLQNTKIPHRDANIVLSQLSQEGEIVIMLEGKIMLEPSSHGIEEYKYIGGE